MSLDRSSSEVRLVVDPEVRAQAGTARTARDEPVCRIAICGNFTGRSNADLVNAPVAAMRIDRDDFDDVLATLAPTMQLDLGGGMRVDIRIRDLDDFHPDQLFDRVPQFAQLRIRRAELADPATFQRAAAALVAPPPPSAPDHSAATASGNLLDAILVAHEPVLDARQFVASRSPTSDLDDFVQRAVAPFLIPQADPRQADLLAQIDDAIAASMRALLHHPTFQSVEALWRGVFRFVRNVDTDARLQVYLVELSRDALDASAGDESDVRTWPLFERLHATANDGWGLLVAHHAFGGNERDIARLARLAAVGAALDAPVIGEAHPDLVAGETPAVADAAWRRLRESSHAPYLGLALPRVLLRLPYGAASDPIERFTFEELERADAHESYLWGNPALSCATLIAQGFAERGYGLTAGSSSTIDRLPLHMVKHDGETIAKPCAEVVMRESDAVALLDAGVMPLCGLRDQDAVRIPRIQSVATPTAALAGRLAR